MVFLLAEILVLDAGVFASRIVAILTNSSVSTERKCKCYCFVVGFLPVDLLVLLLA